MKNIIIVAPGRNGKTTLARKINEELNYFVINLLTFVPKNLTLYAEISKVLNAVYSRS